MANNDYYGGNVPNHAGYPPPFGNPQQMGNFLMTPQQGWPQNLQYHHLPYPEPIYFYQPNRGPVGRIGGQQPTGAQLFDPNAAPFTSASNDSVGKSGAQDHEPRGLEGNQNTTQASIKTGPNRGKYVYCRDFRNRICTNGPRCFYRHGGQNCVDVESKIIDILWSLRDLRKLVLSTDMRVHDNARFKFGSQDINSSFQEVSQRVRALEEFLYSHDDAKAQQEPQLEPWTEPPLKGTNDTDEGKGKAVVSSQSSALGGRNGYDENFPASNEQGKQVSQGLQEDATRDSSPTITDDSFRNKNTPSSGLTSECDRVDDDEEKLVDAFASAPEEEDDSVNMAKTSPKPQDNQVNEQVPTSASPQEASKTSETLERSPVSGTQSAENAAISPNPPMSLGMGMTGQASGNSDTNNPHIPLHDSRPSTTIRNSSTHTPVCGPNSSWAGPARNPQGPRFSGRPARHTTYSSLKFRAQQAHRSLVTWRPGFLHSGVGASAEEGFGQASSRQATRQASHITNGFADSRDIGHQVSNHNDEQEQGNVNNNVSNFEAQLEEAISTRERRFSFSMSKSVAEFFPWYGIGYLQRRTSNSQSMSEHDQVFLEETEEFDGEPMWARARIALESWIWGESSRQEDIVVSLLLERGFVNISIPTTVVAGPSGTAADVGEVQQTPKIQDDWGNDGNLRGKRFVAKPKAEQGKPSKEEEKFEPKRPWSQETRLHLGTTSEE